MLASAASKEDVLKNPLLRVALQLLAASGWLAAVLLLWPRSRIGAVALLAAGFVTLVLVKKHPATDDSALPAGEAEKQARLLVTQILGALSRTQVAYLSQSFDSQAEARAWLRRSLPRSYRPMLEQLHRDLEANRRGERPEGLALVRRIIEVQDEVQRCETALQRAHEAQPGPAVASPVVYVVTEHIRVDAKGEEPLVVTLASIDPTRATLVAPVDAVSIFTEKDGERLLHGHTDFASARRALRLRRLKTRGTDQPVYVLDPVDEIDTLHLDLARPPLGFVVGASEFV